jgi:transposase
MPTGKSSKGQGSSSPRIQGNLEKEKKEPERLERLLELNSTLTKMNILKEDFSQFWEKDSRKEAEAAIDAWIADAMGSEIPLLIRLPEVIERHKEGILNYYTYRVSSGPLEGFNNKIKFFVRRAYGYRNMKFFKLVILAANEITPNKFSAFDTS